MTSGRSPYADDPDEPRYGPGASPTYGPPATPPTYGPPPGYGPAGHDPSTTSVYGPPATPTYGLPAARPVHGPASTAAWPVSPSDHHANGYGGYGDHSGGYSGGYSDGAGWSPAPIERAAPVATRARRGQWLSWTVLVLAVVVAAVLGICTYLGLSTIRITAADPWGTAWTWLTICAAAVVAAVVVFLLGVLALFISRPKWVAALATTVALVLPVVVLKFALSFGIEAAARHASMDGAALVDLLTAGLDQLGSVAGPARDVLEWVLRLVASQV